MKIVCPTCTTSYDVGAAALGERGRSVRCVRCRTVWFATPSDEPAVVEEAALVADTPAESAAGDEVPPEDFDWSFSVDQGSPEADKAAAEPPPASKDEGKSQEDIDALWAAAEAEPVVETAGPSIVPAMGADAAAEPIV